MYRKLAGFLMIAFDNFKGRGTYRHKKYLERTQWLKRAELRRLQFKMFKTLLRHAYENVPHYHHSFREANLRPDDVKSFEDIRKVPILKRSTVRDKLDQMVAGNVPKKEFITRFTNGTTAAPVQFYRDRNDVGWGVAAELRGYGWAGYEVGDRVGLVWRFFPERERSLIFRAENALRRYRILNVRRLSEESMRAFAGKMHIFKPEFISGYAGSVNIFAAFLLENERFNIRPKAVFTTSETLLPHYRKTIREAFRCEVYDHYGCTEMSTIAAQCEHSEGLHVNEENVLLETVKEDEYASPHEEGRVLVTNLHNFAMPFIRYEVGDAGKMLSGACACGRELSLFKPVGRSYEYFVNRNGSISDLRDFRTVFEDLPIKDYQVVQESSGEIVLKIASRQGYTKAHTDFILKNVTFAGKPEVRVELVDSIPPSMSGKIAHHVSRARANRS